MKKEMRFTDWEKQQLLSFIKHLDIYPDHNYGLCIQFDREKTEQLMDKLREHAKRNGLTSSDTMDWTGFWFINNQDRSKWLKKIIEKGA